MQLAPSAQANWSSEHGGIELKERVDGRWSLLEEFVVGFEKVFRSKGTVRTASAISGKESFPKRNSLDISP